MKVANKLAYTGNPDNLIYDSKHPIDAENVEVTLAGGSDGTIKRGQVIDQSGDAYSIHAAGGTPSVIAAEDIPFEASELKVVVPAYTSGSFRLSELVVSSSLTAAAIEGLREKGIFLK